MRLTERLSFFRNGGAHVRVLQRHDHCVLHNLDSVGGRSIRRYLLSHASHEAALAKVCESTINFLTVNNTGLLRSLRAALVHELARLVANNSGFICERISEGGTGEVYFRLKRR